MGQKEEFSPLLKKSNFVNPPAFVAPWFVRQKTVYIFRRPPCLRDAAQQGRTRTDFLNESALEKAERGIAEQTLIRLTLRDQELLAKALTEESVSESNRFLKSLTSEYGERVTQAWSCFLGFYPHLTERHYSKTTP